jgi:uncharacterized membrane protein YcaP (DUF421 family)
MSHDLWHHMFYLELPLTEKILRSVLVYAFLIVGLRLAGKRELAQMNPFDLIVLMTLSNTVQNAIIGDDNSLIGGLVGAATLLIVNYLVIRFLYNHKKLSEIVEGTSELLIENGQVNFKTLKTELITEAELQAAAYKQGFSCMEEIEKAEIEPGGIITFTGKKKTSEDLRYESLLQKLDHISQEIASLKTDKA